MVVREEGKEMTWEASNEFLLCEYIHCQKLLYRLGYVQWWANGLCKSERQEEDLDVRTVITSMLSSLVQSLNCQGQIQKTPGFTQQ